MWFFFPYISHTFLSTCRSAVKQPTSYRPRMLLAGRAGAGQTSHLAPAVLHALERFTVHSLDSAVLFGVSSTSPEEACTQVTPQHTVNNILMQNFTRQIFLYIANVKLSRERLKNITTRLEQLQNIDPLGRNISGVTSSPLSGVVLTKLKCKYSFYRNFKVDPQLFYRDVYLK